MQFENEIQQQKRLEISLLIYAGLDSMDYGKDTQRCTLMVIWFSPLVKVITRKIGSMHMWPGLIYIYTFLIGFYFSLF